MKSGWKREFRNGPYGKDDPRPVRLSAKTKKLIVTAAASLFSLFFFTGASGSIMVIQAEAGSPDFESKERALDGLKEFFIDKGIKDKDVLDVLRGLSLDGTRKKYYNTGLAAPDFPDIRRRAVEYMGEFSYGDSGEETIKSALNILKDVATIDREPAVIAEVFSSLAKIEKDDTDEARREGSLTFVEGIFIKKTASIIGPGGGMDSGAPDNRLALSYLKAVRVFVTNGAPLKKEILLFLIAHVKLVSGNYNYISAVRKEAESLLVIIRDAAENAPHEKRGQ